MMIMRTRRAALTAIAGAASLALTLSACGQDSKGGSEESTGSAKGGTIGIAMPTKSSERWIADGNNVVKNLQSKGYKTKLVYGEDDPDQQVSQIENLITQGVKGLIIAAIDNKSLNNVLQQAADAKIPVISYDRLILGTKNVDYYASFDNEKVGRLQGGYIVDKLGLKSGKGPFNIELFAGSNDDNNTRYFFKGAMSVLQPYIDSKKLVVKSGQTKINQVTTLRWDGTTAQHRMEDVLTSSYKSGRVDAVLSPYDGISIGIISALKSDGYGSASKPLPVISGQDAELASVKSIIAGQQTMTVYKDLRKLAKVATNMVDDALNGKKPEINDTKSYNNGTKVVPAYLLQPVSVDKSNYVPLQANEQGACSECRASGPGRSPAGGSTSP
jgi:putative multiple sugar transport system substrate-binding protein